MKKTNTCDLLKVGHFKISIPLAQKKNWEFWMAFIRTAGTLIIFAKAVGFF